MPARWSCATVAERGKLGRIAGGGVKTAWRARARPRSMETPMSKRTARLRARARELGSAACVRRGAPAGRRGLGLKRALPGSRERACRGAPPRLPWAQASSARSPPGRCERAPGELRPSRHGCAWRAAAPRPPQVQAKASSARPPVRARELRPTAAGAGAGELCLAARSRTPRSRSPGQVPG